MSEDPVPAREAYDTGVTAFRKKGRSDQIGDLRKLMAHFLGVDPVRLDYALDDAWSDDLHDVFTEASDALLSGVPLSRLVQKRAFWKGEFHIGPEVLDPRPDTETLVEAALKEPFTRVLDLGTGSGCILISLLNERREATGVGTDISDGALNIARRNAQEAGCKQVATFVRSDWFSNVHGQFDLIVSNPPYIDAETYAGLDANVRNYDPKHALTPGETGLEAYQIIVPQALEFLSPDGWLMVEIGFDQGNSVKEIFENAGYCDLAVLPDMNGKDRVVSGKAPQSLRK